jgi:AcrR family transcriptional regulator
MSGNESRELERDVVAAEEIAAVPISERAARQRTNILDAAERCFIQSGFHAASMADIATTAGVSPGLIYRYFSGKNEIVQAIVQQHLETDGCPSMRRLNTREDFVNGALEMFERWRRRDDPSANACLMLELVAESARDPEVAAIVRGKDQAVSEDLTLALQRVARAEGKRLTALQARSRAVMMQCVVEGLASRVVRDPTLSAATLRPILAKIIDAILS